MKGIYTNECKIELNWKFYVIVPASLIFTVCCQFDRMTFFYFNTFLSFSNCKLLMLNLSGMKST